MNSSPNWDEGYRESRYVVTVEEPRLFQRQQRFNRLVEWLARRYRDRTWPPTLLQKISERQEALTSAREEMERNRYEPWFPTALLVDIKTITGVCNERFLEDLFLAVSSLVEARRRQQVGRPFARAEHQQQLKAMDDAIVGFLMAFGKDVSYSKRLIGGWAEAGLLNGLTLDEIISGMAALHSEVSMRRHRLRPLPAHKPRDTAFTDFVADVVGAMEREGLAAKTSRQGKLAKLVIRLGTAAGEQAMATRDVLRPIRLARDLHTRRQQERAQASRRLAEFVGPRRKDPRRLLDAEASTAR